MQRRILTVNSGSSSIKYAVYESGKLLTSGKLENLVPENRQDAIARLASNAQLLDGVTAIGYRVVHGGMHHIEPELVTPELIEDLKKLSILAPDHLPDQIAAIEAFQKALPHLPAVACFDTAFHRTMPRVAQLFGLPRELAGEGVIRYGFHGLSYSYIVDELRSAGELPDRLIVAHLGNGASMAAIRNGRSIDTSMGLTPTGGFLMSTRSGDLDPGVVLHLIRERKMTPDRVYQLVTREAGLKGLSGISSDMRELIAQGATEAIATFCYQIRKFLGAFIAALGGLDALVFTGGIGEHSPEVRIGVCEGLDELGIAIDALANQTNAALISKGRVSVRVIPTNEELMIARLSANVLDRI